MRDKGVGDRCWCNSVGGKVPCAVSKGCGLIYGTGVALAHAALGAHKGCKMKFA